MNREGDPKSLVCRKTLGLNSSRTFCKHVFMCTWILPGSNVSQCRIRNMRLSRKPGFESSREQFTSKYKLCRSGGARQTDCWDGGEYKHHLLDQTVSRPEDSIILFDRFIAFAMSRMAIMDLSRRRRDSCCRDSDMLFHIFQDTIQGAGVTDYCL